MLAATARMAAAGGGQATADREACLPSMAAVLEVGGVVFGDGEGEYGRA